MCIKLRARILLLGVASKPFHYLSEVAVAVDVLLLMTILQLVVLDVEPKSLHDAGPRLCVHAQQTSQPRVQFVLRGLRKKKENTLGQRKSRLKKSDCLQDGNRANGRYLVVEHEQEGAFNIHIAGPFDLETIGLLSGGHSVPLRDKMKQEEHMFSIY